MNKNDLECFYVPNGVLTDKRMSVKQTAFVIYLFSKPQGQIFTYDEVVRSNILSNRRSVKKNIFLLQEMIHFTTTDEGFTCDFTPLLKHYGLM